MRLLDTDQPLLHLLLTPVRKVILLLKMIPYFRHSPVLLSLYIKSALFELNPLFRLRLRRERSQFTELGEALTEGKTSFHALAKLLRLSDLSKQSHFVELGCSSGICALSVHHYFNCKVTGIEIIPAYIRLAKSLSTFNYEGIQFQLKDMFTDKLPEGTHYFVTGTCFNNDQWDLITERFLSLPRGTWIITTTQALPETSFKLLKTQKSLFEWGIGTMLLYKRL